MNINEIDKLVEPKKPKLINPTRMYGVMGLSLGAELHARLKKHCMKRGFPMAKLIKILIKSYLDEKDQK
mgnify:FL=1|jgi:hypothetical protein|tara:strand:- start:11 stop:217 length:207 start_codon:yes stop_codon:yes gene_type:complete